MWIRERRDRENTSEMGKQTQQSRGQTLKGWNVGAEGRRSVRVQLATKKPQTQRRLTTRTVERNGGDVGLHTDTREANQARSSW